MTTPLQPETADSLPAPAPTRGSPAWQRWLKRLSIDAALMILIWMVIQSVRGGVPLPDHAPALPLTLTDGSARGLADYAGKPLVLYFWATWCPACKITSPTVDQFARSHPEVAVVGIALDDPEAVRAYLSTTPRHFSVGFLSEVGQTQWPVHSLPSTIVLDSHAQVLWSRQGALLPGELNWHVP